MLALDKVTAILLFVCALFLSGCEESIVQPPQEEPTLMLSSSFEKEGNPTLEGWRPANSFLTSFASDTPPGGGSWSLKLDADWAPTTGFVYAALPGIHSADIIQLSAYVKALGDTGGGSVEIRTGSTVWSAAGKMVSINDTSWTRISVVDTVAIGEGDSVWVVLSSLHTELVSRTGLFDLVSVGKITP